MSGSQADGGDRRLKLTLELEPELYAELWVAVSLLQAKRSTVALEAEVNRSETSAAREELAELAERASSLRTAIALRLGVWERTPSKFLPQSGGKEP